MSLKKFVSRFAVLATVGVIGAFANRWRIKSLRPVPQGLPRLDTKPAFLLQEIEKDNLAEKFFGEVVVLDAALVK